MTTIEDPPTETAPTPAARPHRHLRRWLLSAGLVLALVAVAGWLVVGSRPRLDSGYTWWVDDAAVHETGSVTGLDTGDVWWVDRSEGTYWSLVRNTGRVAVTLRGDGVDDGIVWQRVGFATVVEPYVRFGTPATSITLAPGQEAQVTVHLEFCGERSPGSTGVMLPVEGLDIDATTWGLTRKVHLDMGGSYGFYSEPGSPQPPAPDCSHPQM